MDECVTRGAASADRVIATIGEHVIAGKTLAGRGIVVCIEESANLRVIVAAL